MASTKIVKKCPLYVKINHTPPLFNRIPLNLVPLRVKRSMPESRMTNLDVNNNINSPPKQYGQNLIISYISSCNDPFISVFNLSAWGKTGHTLFLSIGL